LDFGGPHHMSQNSSSFVFVTPLSSIHVMTIDDTSMPLVGIGNVITPHLSLPSVYLIPNLTLNLVSVGQLCDSGDYLVIFFSFFVVCRIYNIRS
jgi:hypothetical protein